MEYIGNRKKFYYGFTTFEANKGRMRQNMFNVQSIIHMSWRH